MSRKQPPTFPMIPGQRGLATTRQLREEGFTRSMIAHALGRRWQEPQTGVIAPHLGPLDDDARLVAAALWAGPSAVLTGGLALLKHGLPCDGLTHEAVFLVPSTARTRSDALARTVRTTRDIVIATEVDCVAVVGIERALVDAAQHQDVHHRDLKAATLAALQRQVADPEALRFELRRTPRARNAPVATALDVFGKGAWSLPEGEFDALLGSCPELPARLLNPRVLDLAGRLVGTPDVFFPDAGVAVQVHSRQHHSGYAEDGTDLWSLTVEKDGAYTEHSIIVVGVTPRSIARRPQAVVDRVRTVVQRNLGREYGPVVVDGARYGVGGGTDGGAGSGGGSGAGGRGAGGDLDDAASRVGVRRGGGRPGMA